MKKKFLFFLLFSFFSLSISFATDSSFFLDPSLQQGSIHKNITKQNIIQKFGKQNVVYQDVEVGEGEKHKAMLVFPKDPERQLILFWNDEKLSTVRVDHSKSLWKTIKGIGLGTSLKELEKINGKAFTLAGFDWDYGGVVYSWNGGMLAQYPQLRLRLGYSKDAKNEDLDLVVGDREFSSSSAAMQRINPKVYFMSIGE